MSFLEINSDILIKFLYTNHEAFNLKCNTDYKECLQRLVILRFNILISFKIRIKIW